MLFVNWRELLQHRPQQRREGASQTRWEEGPDPRCGGIGSSVALMGGTLHGLGQKGVEVVGVTGSVPFPDGSGRSQLYPIVHWRPKPHHQ